MKKRFAIILTAAALSMTGCSLLGQDTYYIDQGMEQINSGNYEEALTSFSSAEQEGKHLVESYRGSGMAYMALGEYDKAVEAFDRAVDLTKEKQKDVRKDILMYKATALYQSGDYEGQPKSVIRSRPSGTVQMLIIFRDCAIWSWMRRIKQVWTLRLRSNYLRRTTICF